MHSKNFIDTVLNTCFKKAVIRLHEKWFSSCHQFIFTEFRSRRWRKMYCWHIAPVIPQVVYLLYVKPNLEQNLGFCIWKCGAVHCFVSPFFIMVSNCITVFENHSKCSIFFSNLCCNARHRSRLLFKRWIRLHFKTNQSAQMAQNLSRL